MSADAAIIRAWLESVIRLSGRKPTPFAKKCGIAPSTISRALDSENPTELDRTSITRIVSTFGVAGPQLWGLAGGFAEPELEAIRLDVPLFAGDPLTENQYIKRVNSRALNLVGYMPGDELRLDMSVAPMPGDIVEAQIYDLARGTAHSALRQFDPPYLVTRTTDPQLMTRPEYVDGQRVKIMAVVTKALRGREQSRG